MQTKKYYTNFLLGLMALTLSACSVLQIGTTPSEPAIGTSLPQVESTAVVVNSTPFIEVGIEASPTPTALSYSNTDYGLYLEYPESWQANEIDHGVILSKDNLILTINFRWIDEDINPYFGRTGIGAGDMIYADKLLFLEQALPAHNLVYEGLTKAVFYGETGRTEVGERAFMIVLEDLTTDYNSLNLAEQDIAEARSILESIIMINQ